jgi:Leucine-rich repeat (LRR) protein
LRDLRLDANGLNGTLPSELGLLVGLREFLNVFDNDLSGQIPTELGLLTNLELLDVGSNRLTGLLPSEISSLARAVGIGVQQNELSGTVPTEIGALSNLEQLLLARNHFVGSLDAFFCVSRLDDPLYDFQSDCLEIQCSCCTTCCSDIDGSCIEQ